MLHCYEVRKLEENGKTTTIEKFVAEPKEAKAKTKTYAEKHPGLYTLYKAEPVEIYFTEKERRVNEKA